MWTHVRNHSLASPLGGARPHGLALSGAALVLALIATGAGPALAQSYECLNGNGKCTVTGEVAWGDLVENPNFSGKLSDLRFYAYAGALTFSDSTILEATPGTADQRLVVYGGTATLSVASGKTLTFQGNTTRTEANLDFGGAVVAYYNANTINFSGNTNFIRNSVQSRTNWAWGGAIFASSSTMTFSGDVLFDGNSAQSETYWARGGAIFNWHGPLEMSESATFTGNTATSVSGRAQGGAIFNQEGTLTLKGSTSFDGNKVAVIGSGNASTAGGGALYNTGTVTFQKGATFTGNTAFSDSDEVRGGAIENSSGTVSLSGKSAFTGNAAASGSGEARGGAIENSSGTVVVAGEASFTGNSATSTSGTARGGAIFSGTGGTIILDPDAGKTILFSGNRAGDRPNSIYLLADTNATVLRVGVSGTGTVDMRTDPMGGSAVGGGAVILVKESASTWWLGGENLFTADDNATSLTLFEVNSGTLALAAGTQITLQGALSRFALGDTAVLHLEGGGHTILAGSGGQSPAHETGGAITLSGRSKITFDLLGVPSGETVLTLRAERVGLSESGDAVTLDIRTFRNVVDTEYTLLDAGTDLTDKTTLTYRGEALANTRVGAALESRLEKGNTIQVLKVARAVKNDTITWVGSSGDTWNISTPDKWRQTDGKLTLFAPGDAVVFTAANQGTVSINDGGVVVAGMEVTGGAHTFTGGEIVSASDGETSLRDGERTGKLVIAGGASATFEDTVNLDFANGYDIADGARMTVRGQSLGGDIANAGTFVFDLGAERTLHYTDTLSGKGAVLKEGTGTVILSGKQMGATGPLTLNGGTLGGAFTWGGGLKLGGPDTTLAPGDPDKTGTLSVNDFDPGGQSFTLRVRVTPEGSDCLEIRTGSAEIPDGSTLKVVSGGGSGWAAEKIYTVVVVREAGQTIAGTFSTLDRAADLPFLALEQVRLDASGTPVDGSALASAIGVRATYRSPGPGPARLMGMTPNEIATAEAIDTMEPGPVQDTMINTTESEGLRQLDLFSGDGHANVGHMIRQGSPEIGRTLLGTLSRLAPDGDGIPGEETLQVAGIGPVTLDPSDGVRRNHRLWAQVSGAREVWDGDGNAARSTASGPGIMAGATLSLDDGWFAGGLVRYGYRDFRVPDRLFRADAHSVSGGVYGGKVWDVGAGTLRTTLAGIYTRYGIDSRRTAQAERLKASYGANVFQVMAEAAWRAPTAEGLTVEPFVAAAWNRACTEDFTESGGPAALHSRSWVTQTGTSTVGLRLDARIHEQVVLRLDLGWEHVYGDINTTSRQVFVSGSDDFSVRGTPADRDTAVLAAGASVILGEDWTLNVIYDGAYGAHTLSHGGRASVIWRW
ncbi:autotransporter domain-containing protein [Phaeovibrio sulfidiphilus]|uniref:Autotransporter domain-containing protein n=1 Tax=Phaeovibrio sulfidiphilus TaxID=1220600 RepID=A0A8J6YQK0_9PROT|nr:autotransporter outer membrane beta-barrel domain-containing protein [Phaeovibrio sulfidiphilus]MBE1238004.1 autotransporter domain-containing protein [Phaeovibrio sulfidiphilus]